MKELEEFDLDLKPASPAASGREAGLDSVPDGDYEWAVVDASYKTTQKTGTRMVTMRVLCESLGVTVERPSFLTSQDGANILCGELSTLGFDTVNWTPANKRPFSTELPKALEACRGRRFKGTKKTNTSNGKSYHNLYINAPLPAVDPSTLPDVKSAAPSGARSDEISF